MLGIIVWYGMRRVSPLRNDSSGSHHGNLIDILKLIDGVNVQAEVWCLISMILSASSEEALESTEVLI